MCCDRCWAACCGYAGEERGEGWTQLRVLRQVDGRGLQGLQEAREVGPHVVAGGGTSACRETQRMQQ